MSSNPTPASPNLNIFQKAANYLNLSPEQRAVVKFVYNLAENSALLVIALFAQVLIGFSNTGTIIGAGASIDWSKTAWLALALFLFSFKEGLVKFMKAHADPALTTGVDVGGDKVIQAVEQQAGLPDVDWSKGPTAIIPIMTANPNAPTMKVPIP